MVVGDDFGTQIEGGTWENGIGEELLELGLVFEDAAERGAVVTVQLRQIACQAACLSLTSSVDGDTKHMRT